ncbi:Hypothetical protein Asd1617_05465 [Shigella dysenteriae 1617]|uniref:Uncharacterized protein n=1 Tax=Shigella dysenteriae 1617 TaxID=754093 RepID=A0A0A7A237_SHIDY|nr:Hypothetical protein Asd1617_05465 [Shigella dysenteriae 1617]
MFFSSLTLMRPVSRALKVNSKVMAFYHPFKVRFYEYYSPRGIPDGVSAALLPVTVTLDIITAPLQFLVVYAVNQ